MPANKPDILSEAKSIFRKYLNALAAFYGRISLKDAFDIIQYQNDSSYNFKEFVAFGLLIFPQNAEEKYQLIAELTDLLVSVHNVTRMWKFRGHTPEGVRESHHE